MSAGQKPIQVINTFTVRAGMMDEFVRVQEEARPHLARENPGLRGSRLYRALDGKTAVLIGVYDSADDNTRLQQSELFARHRARLQPLVESASPAVYEVAYQAGEV